MKLSLNQYAMLNSCCNDLEIFFFLFAEVNYKRNVNDGDWTIHVQANELFSEIIEMVNRKLLVCWKFENEKRTRIHHPISDDFALYWNYECKTFDEHMVKYGYGPHEFQATQKGLDQMRRKAYLPYDRILNYDIDEGNVSRRKDEIVEAARRSLGIELHSETEVSKLLSIPQRRVVSIARSLRIGTNITFVRYFSDEDISIIKRASQADDRKGY